MSQKITVNCRPDSTCEANTLTGQYSIPTVDELMKSRELAVRVCALLEQAGDVPCQSAMRAAAKKADGIKADETYASTKKTISGVAKKAAFDAAASFDILKVGLVKRGAIGESKSTLAVKTVNTLLKTGKLDSAKTKHARQEAGEAWAEGNHVKVKELSLRSTQTLRRSTSRRRNQKKSRQNREGLE